MAAFEKASTKDKITVASLKEKGEADVAAGKHDRSLAAASQKKITLMAAKVKMLKERAKRMLSQVILLRQPR